MYDIWSSLLKRARSMIGSRVGAALVAIIALAACAVAMSDGASAAGAIRPGFDSNTLARNDDGSTGLVPFGFTIDFFGLNRTGGYINNNGNITLDSALSTFTPFVLSSTGRQIIAPFFADVDTRSAGDPVKYGTGTVGGRSAFGASYRNVDCYSSSGSTPVGHNYFQVILIERFDTGAGNFDIEFNYDQILWETGQASGGNVQCRGGSPARVGWSNGTNLPGQSFELPGSGVLGAFLDGGPAATRLVGNSLNSSQLGRYVFSVRDGTPLPPTNQPPTCAGPIQIVMTEDVALARDLRASCSDPNAGDTISIEIVSLSLTGVSPIPVGPGILPGGSITLTPAPNYNGPGGSFQFRAKDSSGAVSNIVTANVVVNPVNDSPVVINPAAVSVVEGEGISVALDGYVTDIETLDPDILWSAVSNHSSVIVNVDIGARVLHIAGGEGPGGGIVTITAADRGDPSGCVGSPPGCSGPLSASAGFAVTVTVPPAPAFSVDSTPPPGACICTPEIMNTNVSGVEHWWVKADGSGTLKVDLTAHSVNNVDPETVVARIFPASGTGTPLATITASYPGGTPAGTEVTSSGSISTTAGTVYLIKITTPAPTPATQPHYSLKFWGALDAAIKSPTFASLEPHDGARWFFNVPSASEAVNVRIFNAGTPFPTLPSLTADVSLYAAGGGLLAGPTTFTSTNPPGTFDHTISGVGSGPGKVFLLTSTNMHYRLERTGGTDNDVYLNWLTYGFGKITGTVVTGTGAPSTAPATVTFASLTPGGPTMTEPVLPGGTFSSIDLPVGTYKVTINPGSGVSVVGTISFIVDVLCDQTESVQFKLNRQPTVNLTAPVSVNEGAAPAALSTTSFDPDGDPVVFTWSLLGPGTLVPSGPSATYANADGPAGASVTVAVADGFGGTDDDTKTINTLNVAPVLSTGKIVVNNDEWTFSDLGFGQNPGSATQFIRNVADYFTGGTPGNFLAYSTNFGLIESSLNSAMIGAGHGWTVSTAVPFTVASLQAYDGVFLAGPVGSGPSQQVLIDYVNAGGNVYVAAGTGCCGGAAGESAIWDTFLNAFGLDLAPVYNGISGNPSPASVHPLLAGVTTLYFNNGNSVSVTNPAIAQVLFTLNGQGMLAVAAIGSVSANSVNEGGVTTLSASFTDPGLLDTHTVTINWGDGSPATVLNLPLGARSFSAAHTYVDDGASPGNGTASDNNTIGITVTDKDLASDSESTAVTVQNVAPSGIVLSAPVIGENGVATINGTFVDPGLLDVHTVVITWGPSEGSSTLTLPVGARTFSLTHQYLDDNPTATPTDSYAVSVTVSDDDAGVGTATTQVVVNNAAPSVSMAPASQVINETDTASVVVTVSDAGTQDTCALVISWGEGTPVTQAVPCNGSVTLTHQYVDDNPTGSPSDTYTVSVTVTDDDTGHGAASTTVVVNNVAPSLTLDTTGSVTLPSGLQAFLGRKGVAQNHSATATDIGPDDLTFDWNSGQDVQVYASGGVFPFSATDTGTVNYTTPAVTAVNVTVTDDDSGTASASFAKIVTDDCDCTKSQGFWKKQFDPKRKGNDLIPLATLGTYLGIVDAGSALFGPMTIEQANGIMDPKPAKNGSSNGSKSNQPTASLTGSGVSKKKNDGSDDDSDSGSGSGSGKKLDKAKAQTLAAWLNFAKGAIGWTELVDINGDKVGDRTFGSIIAEVESILSNPNATDADIERAKDLAEAVNLHDKSNPDCDTGSGSASGSSASGSGTASKQEVKKPAPEPEPKKPAPKPTQTPAKGGKK